MARLLPQFTGASEMRTIELTDEQMEADDEVDTPEFAYVDWKESAGSALETIDEQLAAFGLEIVQVDTGDDGYMWKIDKREPQS
jgi:hypothetical protein